MADIYLVKTAGGQLAPADQAAVDALGKIKLGATVAVSMRRPRNYQFHKKFLALLNLAFESWEPQQKEYRGEKVAKNFKQFRNDITVLAGFYDTTYTLNNEVRLTAKSISYASMSQEDFELLYSAAANVILSRVLRNYTRADLDEVVEKILGFV